jgi:hypothetical protein
MPNLDGGHYFFTAFVPVCNRGIVAHEKMKSSPIHMVREALETLPTALQSHAAEQVGIQSPFARSTRTHFARLVVLDQPFYNGRDHADALVSAIKGTDLLEAEPHDRLACPYLMVMIDFDPVDATGAGEPRAYFEHLWGVMEEELKAIFSYCYGFSAVKGPEGFADFILPCQIETTMPFNDYWTGAPPLASMSKLALAVPPLAGIALAVAGGVLHWWSTGMAVLLGIVFAILGLVVDYFWITARGGKSFPSSNASLPHVLKALYLQQAFARFAAAQQGAAPAATGAAFRAFLEANRPSDLAGPTQAPGVIRSSFAGGTP